MTSASRSSAAQAPKLKAAVKVAKLSKSVKKKVSYTKTKTTYTLVVKGVRTSDEHRPQEPGCPASRRRSTA